MTRLTTCPPNQQCRPMQLHSNLSSHPQQQKSTRESRADTVFRQAVTVMPGGCWHTCIHSVSTSLALRFVPLFHNTNSAQHDRSRAARLIPSAGQTPPTGTFRLTLAGRWPGCRRQTAAAAAGRRAVSPRPRFLFRQRVQQGRRHLQLALPAAAAAAEAWAV